MTLPSSPDLPFSTRGVAIRLFFTCWLIFSVHLATNTVREIYLALAIGDHFSFRVDEYGGMHPDLFEKPGYGWHIGNNPGASMLGAVPYALARPAIDVIVDRVNRARAASGHSEPPGYASPWPMARAFYQEAWRRGYDIKFGLASVVIGAGCMAPLSALASVVMFYLLRRMFGSDRTALWLALLYAFGTPVFFRTGCLNQNMLAGHAALLGFAALWTPAVRRPALLAGVAGGVCLLLDYSGALVLAGLGAYCLLKSDRKVRDAVQYMLGATPLVLLLWLYQWRSFGNPFLPGQHWMPPVEWIELGYQGVSGPQLDLAASLLFDYRYGLFLTCPLLMLALAAPLVDRPPRRLPAMEMTLLLALFVLFWIFFSGVNYTRLQCNTGVRYMAPTFPLLFLPAALVLARLPRPVAYGVAVFSVAQAWSMAMCRDVERGLGLLEPPLHVFLGGFQLPVLAVLSRMGTTYGDYFANGASPLPLFALAAVVLWGVWSPRFGEAGTKDGQP